jgi:hypothetical protein|tara:strand:- start:225 stop:3143 length:2919 start_codon:yes stop_codon:yes gene_type:complete
VNTTTPTNSNLSANIPALLKNIDQWLVWKSQPRIGQENKFTKVPYNLRTERQADATSADTWATFDQAIQATGYDGIGFAINQPIGLLLIDLDDCIIDGVAEDWAEELIQICDTYTEYSPSRRGFHLILQGQKLVAKTRFHNKQVEIYDSGRYLTITGEVYQDRKEINDSTTDLLFQHLQQISPAESVVTVQPSITSNPTEVNLPLDRAILTKIQSHPEYSQEWNDLSERDARMAGLTNFYTGNNFDQTERILRATEFHRDKWSDLRQHPKKNDQKITFLRYQIEKNPSRNVYQGQLTPLYEDRDEFHQVLLSNFKQWFKSEDRRIDVVAVTPGGGKTFTAAQALVECCRENPGFIGMLAIHTKKRIKEEVKSIKENFDFEVITILGKDEEKSTGYCRNFAEANKLDMAGFSARNLLCQSKCEFREECLIDGYLSQFELPSDGQSRIYVTTHQSAKNWAEYFGPDVIVFDEYPIGINITQNELTEKNVADYRSCVKKLNGQNFKLVLIFLKTLQKIIKKHSQLESNRSFLRDQQARQLFSDCLSKKYGDQVRDSFFENSYQWRNQLLACQRIFLHQNNPALAKSKTILAIFDTMQEVKFQSLVTEMTLIKKWEDWNSNVCKIQLNHHHNWLDYLAEHTNILILDAYAEESTYSKYFLVEGIDYHRFELETDLHTTHIIRNTGKSKLKKMKARQIKSIFSKLFQQFQFESVLIYTYQFRLDKVEKAIQSINSDIKTDYDYFFNGRGTNEYQDCQAVVIFGSAYPDIDELIAKENAKNPVVPISKDQVNGVYQDPRLVQAIEETQHHEIKQCIHRVRPINNPRQAFLFCSDFAINGLEINQKIQAKEWSGEALSTERLDNYQLYSELIEDVVEELGFYASYFQQNLQLMKHLVQDQDIIHNMEHLIQTSKYGKSFSFGKGGGKYRKDLKLIADNLNLGQAKMKIFNNWKYQSWTNIYCLLPAKDKLLELSTNQIF